MSSKKWNDPQRDAAQFTIGTAYWERGLHGLRGCARVVTIAGARMTISMNMVPEETIEECKRHEWSSDGDELNIWWFIRPPTSEGCGTMAPSVGWLRPA
jgi:hypothetical protein